MRAPTSRRGVLALREPGGPDRGSIGLGPPARFPRVFAAGQFLSPPGRYFPGLAREVSEADLPAAAAEGGRASGAWVKLIGDFFNPDGRITPNWSPAGLTAAVGAAHGVGARVAIHATCEATLDAALEAGVDSIEHGAGLREDHLVALAARGIADLVAYPDDPRGVPDVLDRPSLRILDGRVVSGA